jgi:hypothetical protein
MNKKKQLEKEYQLTSVDNLPKTFGNPFYSSSKYITLWFRDENCGTARTFLSESMMNYSNWLSVKNNKNGVKITLINADSEPILLVQ